MNAHAAAVTTWRWKPAELIALVVGFLAFPPLGLAVLAWKYFKEKNGGVFPWPRRGAGRAWHHGATSGNTAFDSYKRATLDRLEEERRKLREEERAFAAFLAELKQAKDREEFDRFMATRGRV